MLSGIYFYQFLTSSTKANAILESEMNYNLNAEKKTFYRSLSIASLVAGFLLVQAGSLGGEPQAQVVPASRPATVSPAASQRALVDKYCVTCHSSRLHTGGLVLENLSIEDRASAAEWEKVVHKLRTGEMPPPRMPRPDPTTLNAFRTSLEASLDKAAALKPNPGRVAVHRLNRTEYTNAIRDLLALDIDGKSLLMADDVDQHGFNNIAGVLSVSPALLEGYISAARKVSRLAVGDTKLAPVIENYDVPGNLTQEERMSEDLPFDSRGGISVQHRFPLDGEYLIKIRLRRSLYGYILGLKRPHQISVRVNGKLLKTFSVGGDAPPGESPASFSGNITGDTKWDQYMQKADDGLEVRFPATAGLATVGVSFVKDLVEPEDIPQPIETGFGRSINEMYDGLPAVDKVLIGGPYNVKGSGDTPSRRRIFTCRPANAADEAACARQILSALSRRAYRRPVTDQEVQTLLSFYNTGRNEGGGFDAGIQFGIERILADPNFVLRIERDPPNLTPGAVYHLSDFELASRLSFFLWSSIPDDELLDLASRGKLKDPATLEREVHRMFADPRSRALVINFANEWLDLPKVLSATPDPNLYPDFDENLRSAFIKETELFIQDQMRSDRPIGDLLTANYTFVNERLAKHYGIPNIYGSHFRRVTFTNQPRGGLLGQGSVLLATSYPNRTSPVLRGKWLLDNVLGMPPPPPPPDVPALKESAADHATSVRERLEEHRKNPACAGCHVRMDPLGFSLENFDPIGRWRTTSDGVAVDASAAFPDGTKFSGIDGLQKLLRDHRAQFVDTFTEKLLTYALGRETEYYDGPAIRKISQDSAATDYRWSSMILAVVKSVPFQMSIVKDSQK